MDNLDEFKELKEKGLNDSTEHIDFMIGTPDMCVTGIAKDGTKTPRNSWTPIGKSTTYYFDGIFDGCRDVTIRAHGGSVAEFYAQKHGLKFERL